MTESTATLVGDKGICKFTDLDAVAASYYKIDPEYDYTVTTTRRKKH